MALNFPTSPTTGDLYPSPPTSGVPVWQWDGSKWVVLDNNSATVFHQFEYTATAGQTSFSGADANGATLGYTAGFIEVFVNGLKVNKGDFTATTGTSVVLGAAAGAGDLVTIIAFTTLGVANTLTPANNLSDVASVATARANLQVAKDDSAAKAWAYVTVSGGVYTLAASYNVASITKNSTGNVTITFTTPFATAAYAALANSAVGAGANMFTNTYATGSVVVIVRDNSGTSQDFGFSIVCFGRQ